MDCKECKDKSCCGNFWNSQISWHILSHSVAALRQGIWHSGKSALIFAAGWRMLFRSFSAYGYGQGCQPNYICAWEAWKNNCLRWLWCWRCDCNINAFSLSAFKRRRCKLLYTRPSYRRVWGEYGGDWWNIKVGFIFDYNGRYRYNRHSWNRLCFRTRYWYSRDGSSLLRNGASESLRCCESSQSWQCISF